MTAAPSVQTAVHAFHVELNIGGLATFSVGLLHISHLDSHHCSELLQCLPNAFSTFFSMNVIISWMRLAKVFGSAELKNSPRIYQWHIKGVLPRIETWYFFKFFMFLGRMFSHCHSRHRITLIEMKHVCSMYLTCSIDF